MELDRGWNFPIEFTEEGNCRMSSAQANIELSLYLLFHTQKGERVLNPNYGTTLFKYVHAELNETTKNHIKRELTRDISMHEPRVDVHEIEISKDEDPDKLLVIIHYATNNSNELRHYKFALRND